jgi:predicted regulator of Ras-like GTPase activity (Roadblock/LC7/MglB family)
VLSASTVALSGESSTPLIGFSVGEDSAEFSRLATNLVELSKLEGVVGYILRSNSSALIDLPKQVSIADLALLTFQIYCSTGEMAKQFNMNDIESVLVEGKDLKVLSVAIGKNKIDVLLKKTASHALIVKEIHL